MSTIADAIVRRLAAHGVSHVFGYPGGQLTPIYDALHRQNDIRHILARHEQAACFMADGYARASGKPGVCLAVCGPGAFNAATPLATAFTDSVPVLLISGQVHSGGLGARSGYYHENEQLAAFSGFTKLSLRLNDATEVDDAVDRAFAAMTEGRPGTAFLEVPVDVQRTEVGDPAPKPLPAAQPPRAPAARDVEALARLLSTWQRPLLLAGGGVVTAGAEKQLADLATRLGAPVLHTLMGKAALTSTHRLKAGLPWLKATSDLSNMEAFMSPLLAQADGLLAVGCRFSQAATGSWAMKPPSSLAHIDIDPAEIGRHYATTLGVVADAARTLEELLERLPTSPRPPWLLPDPPARAWQLPDLDLVGSLRQALPRDAIVVADITRLSYILLSEFPVYESRTFLHPAGFVSMGFGIPAALGARAAMPQCTIVVVAGDGCFLMSGMELASAVQERLPIVVVLINDGSLSLIKAIQHRRYNDRFIGVDLKNPDFAMFARSFGVRSWQVSDDAAFKDALAHAIACGAPALVEVRLPGSLA
ncbi:MAG: thiamine pyrophosphate-binding protein [Planctomycetes bacterium]|nr:thiamine pyrophosphate-binding protein [Planctomycetota bacterium]